MKKIEISIATDFAGSSDDPRPRLREIAKAGFTHLHWCHQWCTDFIYTDSELATIAKCLKQTGLHLLDIHGSQGREKCWNSTVEYQRKAGVELVANRMWMLRVLDGTGAIMMHCPCIKYDTKKDNLPKIRKQFEAAKKSIRELMPISRALNAPIAVENMVDDNFENIYELLDEFPTDVVGVCYDSGHGNVNTCKGLDNLEKCKDRLMALHLHDNDATGDQHHPPFMGNVDWARVMRIIRSSAYDRQISFELSMPNSGFTKNNLFLEDAHKRCVKAIKAK